MANNLIADNINIIFAALKVTLNDSADMHVYALGEFVPIVRLVWGGVKAHSNPLRTEDLSQSGSVLISIILHGDAFRLVRKWMLRR